MTTNVDHFGSDQSLPHSSCVEEGKFLGRSVGILANIGIGYLVAKSTNTPVLPTAGIFTAKALCDVALSILTDKAVSKYRLRGSTVKFIDAANTLLTSLAFLISAVALEVFQTDISLLLGVFSLGYFLLQTGEAALKRMKENRRISTVY